MLNNSIFYHAITRKTIVGFGSLFSGIKIKRQKADSEISQTINIPISYAPKEKWLVRIEQDPTLQNNTYTTLPRLSFEITSFAYDATRKMNRHNFITTKDQVDGSIQRTYSPVPYNISINLYALTKTQEDGLQIVEQILPFFSPELTMSINAVPESNINIDVPVILESLDVNDEYDGDFETRRFITYTMGFTLKAWMYGPVDDAKIINRVFVNTDYANLDAIGNITTNNITLNWTEKQ